MRIDRLKIRGFKNLEDIDIDFDQGSLETVIIGLNGSGKSNVIEALATIFRDLERPQKTKTLFIYFIKYKCKGHDVEIDHGMEQPGVTAITIDSKKSTFGELTRSDGEYLPNHLFGYYSGRSNRLERIFDRAQESYYREAIAPGAESSRNPRDPSMRKLFYVRERYGILALLTYFAFPDSDAAKFLRDNLGVKSFNSALVVLRKPDWAKRRSKKSDLTHGDPDFWNATGIVRKLLDALRGAALAPIWAKVSVDSDYRRQASEEERAFLFIKDAATLRDLAKPFSTDQSFFAYLETLDLSDLVAEVRIWVDRVGRSGNVEIPFHEISDGEKQLLSVLGLMRFAAHDHSLFLLDEPDTHLNPAWKWNYLSLIKQVAGRTQNCHVIMTSHDPLTIAGLEKSQVQILYRDKEGEPLKAMQPTVDPRGLGVAGVLRQIFGMRTTLDPQTQTMIDERNELLATKSDAKEIKDKLHKLNEKLDALGLAYQSRDPDYDTFLRQKHFQSQTENLVFSPEQIEAQNTFVREMIKKLQ